MANDNKKNVSEVKTKEEDTQYGKYLTFLLDNEFYGIEIKYVIELIGIQIITNIPNVPDYVKGIINLRGKIIPVIDVRLRFQKEERPYDDRTCIIVVEFNEIQAGLIVDSVDEVIDISDAQIAKAPQRQAGEIENSFIKCIGKTGDKIILLLDHEVILADREEEEPEADDFNF